MKLKNVAIGSFDEILIDDGFYILKIQNDTVKDVQIKREIDKRYIQFHFCLKGNGTFLFNDGNYALDGSEEN